MIKRLVIVCTILMPIVIGIAGDCSYAYEPKEPITLLTILKYGNRKRAEIEDILKTRFPQGDISLYKMNDFDDIFKKVDTAINNTGKFVNQKCPGLTNKLAERLDTQKNASKEIDRQQDSCKSYIDFADSLTDESVKKIQEIQREGEYIQEYIDFFLGREDDPDE